MTRLTGNQTFEQPIINLKVLSVSIQGQVHFKDEHGTCVLLITTKLILEDVFIK